MKLHIGCGPVLLPGFVNVDSAKDSAAGVIADARALPFGDGSFERIEALQVLEHLGFTGAVFALAEWRRVTSESAVLAIETPDIEGSFRAFLEARARETRARELGWIFGEESPGQGHLVLFPRDMLYELLDRAGFDVLEEQERLTWTAEPGLRVLCGRRASAAHDALAAFKSMVFARGLIRTGVQTEVVEFENGFARNAWRVCDRKGPPDLIAENIAFSAPMAALWLKEASKTGALTRETAGPWLAAASALSELGLQERMYSAFRGLKSGEDGFRDGYEFILRRGVEAARKTAAAGRADGALLETLGLPGPAGQDADPAPLRGIFFGKIRCVEHADRLRNRGLRRFYAGDLEGARAFLSESANLRVEPFYTLWNLAALFSALADFEAASGAYEKTLAASGHPCRPIVAAEFAALRLRMKRFDEVLSLVSEHPDMRGAREMRLLALKGLGLREAADALMAETGAGLEPPPVRTWPVLVGEGLSIAREAGKPQGFE